MPELVEQMYCSQQIVIPPKFPYILKRYCKAAIKTQPYDLLRWSYEYFNAMSKRRPPPVKLRLEYPVYSTEGGLTRGCLKVLANQLSTMKEIPLTSVKTAWQGFCLDPLELNRIFCLCEVYMRSETVPFLHFIAVAAGLLTKSLTHTMTFLCEALTKEPDGGSAAIPVQDFLLMYKFLAVMNAAKDVKYIDGFREGFGPVKELKPVVEKSPVREASVAEEYLPNLPDDFWPDDKEDLVKIGLVNDNVPKGSKLSESMNKPLIGPLSRSPSMERAADLDRDTVLNDRKDTNFVKNISDSDVTWHFNAPSWPNAGGLWEPAVKSMKFHLKRVLGTAPFDDDADAKLHELTSSQAVVPQAKSEEVTTEEKKFPIKVFDEDGKEIPFDLYGEPKPEVEEEEEEVADDEVAGEAKQEELAEADRVALYVREAYEQQQQTLEDLEETFEDLKKLVDKAKTAHYDLGMVAGRQMSTTSGEFVVAHINKEIMDYIDDQISILPDPDLKKKKAKPEEVAMIREMLESFMDEQLAFLAVEEESVEEEEEHIPDIIVVYAVPGIGPPVDPDTIHEFEVYALDVCKVQADLFMPRNIRHFLCPPMEKSIENYEEVATAPEH